MEAFLQQNLMEVMIGGIIIINIVIWSVVIVRAVIRRQLHLSAWRSFAGRAGLQLATGLFSPPRVSGTVNGRAVALDSFHRSRSNITSTHTRLKVALDNPSFRALQVAQYGVIAGLLDKSVLGGDIQVGDPDFDGRMTVRGDPHEMVRDVFSDAHLRAALLGIRRNAEIHLRQSDTQLVYEAERLERDSAYLTELVKMMCVVADRIESWQPPPGWGIEQLEGSRR